MGVYISHCKITGCSFGHLPASHSALPRSLMKSLLSLLLLAVLAAPLQAAEAPGGPMSEAECAAFESETYFTDALKLRVWDDLGKNQAWFDITREEALTHLADLMAVVQARDVTQI